MRGSFNYLIVYDKKNEHTVYEILGKNNKQMPACNQPSYTFSLHSECILLHEYIMRKGDISNLTGHVLFLCYKNYEIFYIRMKNYSST
jgi:hypothetical protein